MKKYFVILAVLLLGFYMFGCGKKEAGLEEMQEPVSMETMGAMPAQGPAPEAKVQAVPAAPSTLPTETLTPSGYSKPTDDQIQTALKNAGFYTGKVDGKIGPMTKKAIEEFQKANGLEADGRVGPKTWGVLSKYLSVPAQTSKR